jgi:uncharacterized membrane protein YedE/YeeE
MTQAAPTVSSPRPMTARAGLIGAALAVIVLVAILVGARFALMLLIGLGFGVALEGLRFGFAGPWRAMILRREPAGILAQLLCIGIVACFAIPLLSAYPAELTGAQAPVGFAMIGGAFVFGAAMQVVLGCGSGTLINAGSGNPVSLLALPFFALGSFAGAYHLIWWTNLGVFPILTLRGAPGLTVTLVGLTLVAVALLLLGKPGSRGLSRRYVFAALALAGLAVLNLVVSGQPWGVVYGLGLWAAKGVTALGADLSGSAFYAATGSVERLNASILTDYTSLTNFGMIAGAFGVAVWRSGGLSQALPSYPARAWIVTIIAGLLLGYSSRLAFGCNVGAFFSGIATGSLHGWVWFASAFLGAFVGIPIRRLSGLEVDQ